MEIRILRKELQQEYANVSNADHNNIHYILEDFINFIIQNEKLNKIIQAIPPHEIEIEKWVSESNRNGTVDIPKDKAKRTKFFMDLIQWIEGDVYKVSRGFSPGRKLNDHVSTFVEYFVFPVYQYLDAILLREEVESEPISNTVIKESNVIIVNGTNYGSISQNNHQAIKELSELSVKITGNEEIAKQDQLKSVINIDTMKAQLLNDNPNKEILKISRDAVLSAASAAGAAHLLKSINEMVNEN